MKKVSVKDRLLKSLLGGLIYTFSIFFLALLAVEIPNRDMPYGPPFTTAILWWLIIAFIFTIPFYFIRLITLSRKPALCFIINFFLLIPWIPDILYELFGIITFRHSSGLGALMWYAISWAFIIMWLVTFTITVFFFLYDTKLIHRLIKKLKKVGK